METNKGRFFKLLRKAARSPVQASKRTSARRGAAANSGVAPYIFGGGGRQLDRFINGPGTRELDSNGVSFHTSEFFWMADTSGRTKRRITDWAALASG